MNCSRKGLLAFLSSMLMLLGASFASAQQEPPRATKPFRTPVQGVMKGAVPERHVEESFSRHDVIELLAVNSSFDWAKNATFRRDIWNLKFEFKPLRMVWVDMPQPSGKLQRKPVYYLVYSVTNVPIADQKAQPPQFGWMHPVRNEEGDYKVEYEDRPIRFVPQFLLESPEYQKAYADRVNPLALEAIRQREDRVPPQWALARDKTLPREPIHSAVEMTTEIPVGKTLWGVATWEEVDPRIDRFAVYLQGLTNAYRWTDVPERYRAGAKTSDYRKTVYKTLKLNFWRPGDEYYPEESEIRRGGLGKADYEWFYMPGLSQTE